MNQPLLEINDLEVWYKVFEGNLKVLNGVNLKVLPQERIGLVGEMGCGKTTTMKAVINLLAVPPAMIMGGSILLNGRNILNVNRTQTQAVRRKNMSMIFEDPTAALNPVFTIGTQIKDAIKYAGLLEKKNDKQTMHQLAIQALENVSMPDPERILKNYPVQLSGGMRQRVCIALALLSANDLLIADEPDTALDVTIKDQILRLLDDLVHKRGTAIILVSHTLGAVRKMTDRLYVMYAGTILENAETKSLFENPKHPYTQLLLESAPRLTGGGIGKGIQGRIPEYIHPPPGCRFHPRCMHVKPICRMEKPSMITVDAGHEVACHLYT